MTQPTAAPAAHTAFTPAVARPSGAAAIAECITSILEGRPLPEAWRPAPPPIVSAPRTVEEGVARILNGGSDRAR